ncbi:MAG TPA: class I SAM-dependent methyltransferase [Acidimicrobiales bacterium]
MLDDADRYGESFADVYDDWYGAAFDTDGTVERLAAMAGDGPALELGVGTGRLAIPLAARGPLVVGVDASSSMLDRLAAHLAPAPGSTPARVVPLLADMADVAAAVHSAAADDPQVPTGYPLVFCAYNTFLNLHTEDAQRRCLEGVVALLEPDGALVVEAYVPAAPEEIPRTSLDVALVTTDAVVLTCTEHDAATQVVTGQHVELREGNVKLRPWRIRYLAPEQLDAMAVAAGLVLDERWADWHGGPFLDGADGGDVSANHVSVYRPAPGGPR